MKSELHTRARCVCFVVGVLVFLGTGWHRAACADSEDTFEEIATRLHDWQSKIVTLRMKTREEFDPQSKLARDSHLAGVKRVGFEDWIWTDTDAIRGHRWGTHDGKVSLRSMGVVGASRDWTAIFANGASDEARPLQVMLQAGSPGWRAPGGAGVTPLYGLWSRERQPRWLAQRIADKDLRLVDSIELDGRRCPVLGTRDDAPYGQRLALDADHGFLPLQVEGPGGFKYVAEEFSEPKPGLFFPKTGYFLHRIDGEIIETVEWEVLSVEINEPIPAAIWEPPIADGTEVVDAESNMRYVHGGKSYRPGIAAEIADAARESVPGSSPQAKRHIVTGFWWSAGLVVLALGLLAGAILARRAR